MPASFHEEALKAQAVAARTYAYYKLKHNANKDYDLINSISNQAYFTKEDMQNKWLDKYDYYYNKLKDIVSNTRYEVLTHDDEVIISYYFAISNGKTENDISVFKSDNKYLQSVNSSWDKNVKNYLVTKEFTKIEFLKLLNNSGKDIIVNSVKRSDTNHVDKITINNIKFDGINFRKLLGLRSTDFDIEIKDKVYITTRGYGHGVGMSQYGANEMAKMGYKYDEILKYYYQDVIIEKINV